ncbi:glutaredoxin [Gilvimarinus sp. DA14]|uniref:glutaredoxin n=1 Tax=Gilvimarinus sp. DA14 TaxID=2956798 RepID=UPI0020B83BB1|nr:glutaredoxin [Gilvimarinus sp. DA14]UTF59203.1 glutaredoxin [Gilvimarinus sp. DA14]
MATATIFRMKTPQHICPYGIKSKDLLRRKGFKVEDHLLKNRTQTDAFKQEHGVDTTPQTFIDGKRIGGYDELQDYFGEAKPGSDTSYTPVIAIFSVTFLAALALYLNPAPFTGFASLISGFVALSMIVLGIQKLQDLEGFSLQFITYDLLGMHYPRYANVYAFLEVFAGLGMLAQAPAWLVAPPAAFIGTLGAVSVFKAVYIDKRELKCACVGGDSKVPLGFVSLTENLMMIAMAVWMVLR